MSQAFENLTARIEGIRQSAYPLIDMNGQPIQASDQSQDDRYVQGYPFLRDDSIGLVANWLVDAQLELSSASRKGDVKRLDRALKDFCNMTLTGVRSIRLSDFAPSEPHDDDPQYFDPILAREGFHLLVCWLCHESRAWTQYEPPQGGELRLSDSVIYWTPERLAASLSPPIKAISITKRIDKYRKEHGMDPLWLVRPKCGPPNYFIDMIRYMQLEGDPRIQWRYKTTRR